MLALNLIENENSIQSRIYRDSGPRHGRPQCMGNVPPWTPQKTRHCGSKPNARFFIFQFCVSPLLISKPRIIDPD